MSDESRTDTAGRGLMADVSIRLVSKERAALADPACDASALHNEACVTSNAIRDTQTAEPNECCGWPEMGVCEGCPDPETVAWGKANEERIRQHLADGYIPICGSLDTHALIDQGEPPS